MRHNFSVWWPGGQYKRVGSAHRTAKANQQLKRTVPYINSAEYLHEHRRNLDQGTHKIRSHLGRTLILSVGRVLSLGLDMIILPYLDEHVL